MLQYRHNNDRQFVVAVMDIQKIEEICVSYLYECNLHRSIHSKRKQLIENHFLGVISSNVMNKSDC